VLNDRLADAPNENTFDTPTEAFNRLLAGLFRLAASFAVEYTGV
jgi:hypothetical protein